MRHRKWESQLSGASPPHQPERRQGDHTLAEFCFGADWHQNSVWSHPVVQEEHRSDSLFVDSHQICISLIVFSGPTLPLELESSHAHDICTAENMSYANKIAILILGVLHVALGS